MSYQACSSCRISGSFAACLCGHGALLGCGAKPTCGNCEKAHRQTFGPFFKSLMGSAPAARSNAVRTRLLGVLLQTLSYHDDFNARDRKFCFDSLPSAFETNDQRFKAGVLAIAGTLPATPEIAATIRGKLLDLAIERGLERIAEALSEKISASR
jgi:hypothetical protein